MKPLEKGLTWYAMRTTLYPLDFDREQTRNMLKNWITATLLMVAASASGAATDAGRYVAKPSDKTFSQMASRWALYEGKSVVWEAIVDFPVTDADALTRSADLSRATSAIDAFRRVAKVLDQEHRAGRITEPVLVACSPRNPKRVAIVVRTTDQSKCGSSLD
ncbi:MULTISPECIES: hypothetical protein [Cupriavidus]